MINPLGIIIIHSLCFASTIFVSTDAAVEVAVVFAKAWFTRAKHDFSSGTCEDKTTRIFLCFVFCSALGLCLDYDLMIMLMTILMSQA